MRLETVVLFLLAARLSSAQAPAFDVASIKPVPPGTYPSKFEIGHGVLRGGTAPSWLIIMAYDISPHLLEGAPDWAEREFYDVDARGNVSAGKDQMNLMLQTLLATRFHLQVHRVKKSVPGYHLTVENKRKLPPASKEGIERDGPGSIILGRDTIRGHGASMDSLCEFLWGGLQEVVINQTGLDGIYDFTMPYDRQDPSSVFYGLRSLGLHLKKARVKIEVLHVDHIERPSGN